MAASDQSGNNNNKRNRNRNKSRSSNSNSSGNSSNGNGDRGSNNGFVQAKDRTCYKCHKRGHMAKSCRSAGGNYRNDTNPRGSIVCYRCNLTGHIGRNCPQNGDSSRNNGGNGSSSGTSEVDETRKIHDIINDHLIKTSVTVSINDVDIIPTNQQDVRSSVESAPGCSSWVNPDELSEAERSGEINVDRSMIDTSATDDRSDDFACFALAGVAMII
ncbi:putative uncharacterized protein DDB_G0282133 [Planococcus citri]|uniref:putative uncharacterized protein DDB_G0282133 n=1 Tax=Planococcus citri TaxID=170843 RepID=UPI0031FA0C66